MDRPPNDGLSTRVAGPWVRDKLGILEAYYPRFVNACKKRAPRWLYVDGLAGSGVNVIPEEGYEPVWGSAMIALQTSPRFSRCVFLEQGRQNVEALRVRAEHIAPGQSRTERGDVNLDLLPVMHEEVDRRAPTLCLLDPEGIEVHWRTIEELSRFRVSDKGYKTELLILLNVDGLSRLLPLYGGRAGIEDDLAAFFPPLDWESIYKKRLDGEIATPEAAREAYFALYEQGLHDLGYHTVLRRPVRREGRRGGLKYVLVFATDNEAGRRIMDHCFKQVFPREQQWHLPGFEPDSSLA